MLPFAFAGSTELHRISLLLFHLMVVRLVTEGDALLPQLRQPLAVDLDAVGSGSRGVVSEDIAHVVEQARGRQHNRRRTLLAALNSIHEHSRVGMSAVIRFREPLVGSIGVLLNTFPREVQLSQQILCVFTADSLR